MNQSLLYPSLLALIALAGCDQLTRSANPVQTAPQVTVTPPVQPARIAPGSARSAAAFDRTTEAERAAARAAAPAGAKDLGKLTVSLGNPADQGFWLRSNLVKAPGKGTVRLASGATAQVDLLPLQGGGAQLSLAAYRALGLALTDLPQVTVLAR